MASFQWPPQGSGSGGGVTSLNGETGAISLIAGTGISITPSGTNITIANTEAGGSVTSVSVVSANGLAGTVANPTTTPAITISTTVTGLLQGNGTAISAYTGGNLTTSSSNFSVGNGTGAVIGTGTTLTLTEGNLTDSTSGADGITVTNGTNAVLGSGTSIAQAAASASQNGYLTSANFTTFNNKLTSTLAQNDIFVGSASNVATGVAMSGDASIVASGALTLATVNSNTGSFGSSTAIPNFTVNGKGLITAAGTNAVVAPAGTLTGTTLASNVVSSSLTSVGTIATGVWNGTAIPVAYGGTGLATLTANNVILGNGTSSPTFVAPSTSGNVLTSNGTTWVSSPSGGNPFDFFESSIINTNDGGQAFTTFTTSTVSPAFTFTPNFSGKYKVYSSVPLYVTGNDVGFVRIFNTSGSGTLLSATYAMAGSQTVQNYDSVFCQSVYTLVSGTSYQFDIQTALQSTGAIVYVQGGYVQFYMYAERVG